MRSTLVLARHALAAVAIPLLIATSVHPVLAAESGSEQQTEAETVEVSRDQRSQLLWLAGQFDSSARLHQFAADESEQKRIDGFAREAANVARRASSRLRGAVSDASTTRTNTAKSVTSRDASQDPDLSETAGEIGQAIQNRLRQRAQQRQSGDAAGEDGADENERQRVILPAVRENLPQILELVAQAVEDEGQSAGLLKQQVEIQNRVLQAKQDELAQYQGQQFDQAYLGMALIGMLELRSATKVVAEGVKGSLQPDLNRLSEELGNKMSEARQLMEPSSRESPSDDGSAQGGSRADRS